MAAALMARLLSSLLVVAIKPLKGKLNSFQGNLGRLQSYAFAFRNVLGLDVVQIEFPHFVN